MGLYSYSDEHGNYQSARDFFQFDGGRFNNNFGREENKCCGWGDKDRDRDCDKDRDRDRDKCKEKEHEKKDECEKKDDCDSESARALKKIIGLLDCLNNRDLRILDDIIDRLLCSRKKDY